MILNCYTSYRIEDQGRVIHFTTENSGLLTNYIQAIAFDSENSAWISSGTYKGNMILPKKTDGRLMKFDGNEWKYFENRFINESYAVYDKILADNKDVLWLSADDILIRYGHFFSFEESNDSWIEYKDYAYDIFEGHNSTIMVNSNDKIYRIKNRSIVDSIESFKAGLGCDTCLSGFIKMDSAELYYAGNFEQSFVVRIDTPVVKIQRKLGRPSKFRSTTVCRNDSVSIWTSDGNSAYKLFFNQILDSIFFGNFNGDPEENFNTTRATSIQFLEVDSKGNLLAASKWGLFKCLKENGYKPLKIDLPIPFGKGEYINCLSIDKKDRIWIGTRLNGVYVLESDYR